MEKNVSPAHRFICGMLVWCACAQNTKWYTLAALIVCVNCVRFAGDSERMRGGKGGGRASWRSWKSHPLDGCRLTLTVMLFAWRVEEPMMNLLSLLTEWIHGVLMFRWIFCVSLSSLPLLCNQVVHKTTRGNESLYHFVRCFKLWKKCVWR